MNTAEIVATLCVGFSALGLVVLYAYKADRCRDLETSLDEQKEKTNGMEKELSEYKTLCSGFDKFCVNTDEIPFVKVLGEKEGVHGKSVVIKSFRYDPADIEDRLFAVRNAMELIEEIKKA